MSRFKIISRKTIETLTNRREGEEKLGESVEILQENKDLKTSFEDCHARFVLIGIPEDIGIRANSGIGGAQTAWLPVLKSILNVQNTELLPGKELAVAGAFDFSEWMEESRDFPVYQLREMVSKIDEEVAVVLEAVFSAGKIPIVIGGGHNNAYPLLKAASRSSGKALNCINLDAHSDFRAIEGRHSGNGFRYAMMDGYLKKYAVVGLHRNYNSQSVLQEMSSHPDIHFCFYEDIFLHQPTSLDTALASAFRFTAGMPTGIELDLDCIEGVLSSAGTPSGFSALEARRFLARAAGVSDVAYLHLPEGCVSRADGKEDYLVPKLITYLVTDFVRASLNKKTVFIQETEI